MNTFDQPDLARALFEEIGDALFLLDPDTDRLVEVNPVATRLTGFSRAELLRVPATYLFRFEGAGGRERLRGAFTKTIAFHNQDGFLLRTRGDGAWIPVNLTVSRLHVRPKPLGLIIARDDQERRAAFNQTRRVEAELRKVLAGAPAALWSAERSPGPDVELGWQFRYVSPLLAKLAGRPADYFDHPLKWAEAVHPHDREAYRAALRKLLTGSDTEAEQVYRVRTPEGETRWVRDRLHMVRDQSGWPTRLDGCLVDVTEQHEAEDALRQNEQRFRALVEKSRDGIILMDEQGVIRYATPAVRLIHGFDPAELVGRHGFELIHPDDRPLARETLARVLASPGEAVPATLRGLTADGRVQVIETSACNRLVDPSVRAVVVNFRDVTERGRLEEQLRQVQKMEAVGQLAGGVAHDFNNVLTVILGNLETLRRGSGGDRDAILADTERAARRAADLTGQLLRFARRQPLRPAAVDVNELVRDGVDLFRRMTDPRVTIEFAPGPDVRPATADPDQVRQVLMNLCLNARDAMPDGGALRVGTADTAGLPAEAQVEEVRGGGYVRLSVSDTGVGMTPDVQAHIFEPFFTTKEPGKGTGLGLAVVYGIVRQHGGWVTCASEPGRGTRFDVYLPVTEAPVPSPPSLLGKGAGGLGSFGDPSPGPSPKRGGEKDPPLVLIADDDAAVRMLARMGLEAAGYRVAEAADGHAAVAAFRDGDRIGVVVLDSDMPGLTGHKAFAAIRELDPAARVLFASGRRSPDRDPPGPGIGYLDKPYTPNELADAVARLLGGSG
jgi:PAS domain S-box-containing protein